MEDLQCTISAEHTGPQLTVCVSCPVDGEIKLHTMLSTHSQENVQLVMVHRAAIMGEQGAFSPLGVSSRPPLDFCV